MPQPCPMPQPCSMPQPPPTPQPRPMPQPCRIAEGRQRVKWCQTQPAVTRRPDNGTVIRKHQGTDPTRKPQGTGPNPMVSPASSGRWHRNWINGLDGLTIHAREGWEEQYPQHFSPYNSLPVLTFLKPKCWATKTRQVLTKMRRRPRRYHWAATATSSWDGE